MIAADIYLEAGTELFFIVGQMGQTICNLKKTKLVISLKNWLSTEKKRNEIPM